MQVTARSDDPPGVVLSCMACQHRVFVSLSDTAEMAGIVCPRCDGERVERLFDRVDGIVLDVFYRCGSCGRVFVKRES
jgi:DNA-directed RNA polymerase subunit RPC12/RpoP